MQIWSIGMYSGDSPLTVKPIPRINPVLTGQSVTDVRGLYVADPFMLKAGDTWFMFFEVFSLNSGRGEIGLATSRDMIEWKYSQIVLRERFHLSYPYVFEWNNEYFMVPESYEARSVRLYRATSFPTSWEFVGNLLSDENFEDSCVFRFQDRWWILNDMAEPPYYAGKLRLFHADALAGPWTEHPKSPVVSGDLHIARPGGRVLVRDGRVIRFTQDCFPEYGNQVRAFELTELTTTGFQERPLEPNPILHGSGTGWNKSGMHHIDPHLQDGRWMACVDGWYWNFDIG
jgi:hypothetical protein